jgi:hypothetical protein
MLLLLYVLIISTLFYTEERQRVPPRWYLSNKLWGITSHKTNQNSNFVYLSWLQCFSLYIICVEINQFVAPINSWLCRQRPFALLKWQIAQKLFIAATYEGFTFCTWYTQVKKTYDIKIHSLQPQGTFKCYMIKLNPIKYFAEIKSEGVGWVDPVQNKDQWQSLVNTVVKV